MQEPQGPWAGLYVRGDWLEACGLDTPETFDDWEEMLTAFKEKMGATAPMLLYKNGYDNLSLVEISSFFPIDCVLPQLHSSCGSTFLIAFFDIKQLLPVTCKKKAGPITGRMLSHYNRPNKCKQETARAKYLRVNISLFMYFARWRSDPWILSPLCYFGSYSLTEQSPISQFTEFLIFLPFFL